MTTPRTPQASSSSTPTAWRALVGALAMLACPALASGCGTHSLLRPADTLSAGRLEVTAGTAANTIPEAIPVLQVAYGVTDRVELVGQHEGATAIVEARYQAVARAEHGFSLTVGLGGGAVATRGAEGGSGGAAAVGSCVVVGTRAAGIDVYLGNRSFAALGGGSAWLSASRAGVSLPLGHHLRLIAEGGVTLHAGVVTVGEGTAALAVGF
jgi:hypothetical protein